MTGVQTCALPICRDFRASIKIIPGRPDDLSPVAVTLQASCFPSSQGGWGFFARFYRGQDYYNIGFMEDVKRFHIGATFNQDGFFHFYRPKAH